MENLQCFFTPAQRFFLGMLCDDISVQPLCRANVDYMRNYKHANHERCSGLHRPMGASQPASVRPTECNLARDIARSVLLTDTSNARPVCRFRLTCPGSLARPFQSLRRHPAGCNEISWRRWRNLRPRYGRKGNGMALPPPVQTVGNVRGVARSW